jgi:hypothetical protein
MQHAASREVLSVESRPAAASTDRWVVKPAAA